MSSGRPQLEASTPQPTTTSGRGARTGSKDATCRQHWGSHLVAVRCPFASSRLRRATSERVMSMKTRQATVMAARDGRSTSASHAEIRVFRFVDLAWALARHRFVPVAQRAPPHGDPGEVGRRAGGAAADRGVRQPVRALGFEGRTSEALDPQSACSWVGPARTTRRLSATRVALADLDRTVVPDHLTSLFVDTGSVAVVGEFAASAGPREKAELLRGPVSGPWDCGERRITPRSRPPARRGVRGGRGD